jgi:hypothetical protein
LDSPVEGIVIPHRPRIVINNARIIHCGRSSKPKKTILCIEIIHIILRIVREIDGKVNTGDEAGDKINYADHPYKFEES